MNYQEIKAQENLQEQRLKKPRYFDRNGQILSTGDKVLLRLSGQPVTINLETLTYTLNSCDYSLKPLLNRTTNLVNVNKYEEVK